MKKISYILKKLKGLQWKNMWNVAKEVSKKVKKPAFVILLDIICSAFLYGSGYMDYFEFEFFLLTHRERKTYLTSALNNKIIAKYNDKQYFKFFSDKILFNQTFDTFIQRDYINLQNSSLEDFKNFLKNKTKFIAKVIDSCGGKGIDIYNKDDFEDIQSLYDLLQENKQYLVEELIEQHSKMNELYSKSVNSLRIITFVKDDGTVEILNIVLRIGNGGTVDNFSSGGMYTFVSDEGVVLLPAIDEKGNIYYKHPITHVEIPGFQLPNFDEVISFVRKLALVEPHVRYVGWDIAITKDGIDVIEGNEYSGVFQMKPSISNIKVGLLPKYKKYMDI